MAKDVNGDCDLRIVYHKKLLVPLSVKCRLCNQTAMQGIVGDWGTWTIISEKDLNPTTAEEFAHAYETLGGLLTLTALAVVGPKYDVKENGTPPPGKILFGYILKDTTNESVSKDSIVIFCWHCVNKQYQSYKAIIEEPRA